MCVYIYIYIYVYISIHTYYVFIDLCISICHIIIQYTGTASDALFERGGVGSLDFAISRDARTRDGGQKGAAPRRLETTAVPSGAVWR